MTIITSLVDSNKFAQVFTAQELTEMCIKICTHIFGLFASYHKTKSKETKLLNKHDADIQLRLGVMGRVASNSILPITVQPRSITILMNEYNERNEVENVEITHDLLRTDMKHVCPDVLVDFLLILLSETVKCLQSLVPGNPRHINFGNENLTIIRDIISDLRPLCKIPYLPIKSLNSGIISLSVEVEVTKLN